MSTSKFELNVFGTMLIYFIAIVAGIIDVALGIAAFVCITVLLVAFMWTGSASREARGVK